MKRILLPAILGVLCIPFASSGVRAVDIAVTNTLDAGIGSLRQAMLDANTNALPDRIIFAIPGAGPHTIQPLLALPIVADGTEINGYTQAGASPNTLADGIDAVLMIIINGALAGAVTGALDINNFAATPVIVRGLVINGFANTGILVRRGANVIEGNFIGTDVNGMAAVPNGLDGIDINFVPAPGTRVGGPNPAQRNLISGNTIRGIGLNSDDIVIQGNFIGTDRTGMVAIPNGSGIGTFDPTNNILIGGPNPGEGNLISGNTFNGILYLAMGTGGTIQGNFIGVDVTGTMPLGNGNPVGDAIGILDGDALTITDNILSASGSHGLQIASAATNIIQRNIIGSDVTGTLAFGNGNNGIEISGSSDNTIGGPSAADGNLVVHNGLAGIVIETGVNGDANDNLVQNNTVHDNGGAGVEVESVLPFGVAERNTITENSIHSNGGLGIDLINGGNLEEAAPIVDKASGDATSTRVEGSLASLPANQFVIEIFANRICDAPGAGEGRTFLGAFSVMTDGAGNVSFDETVPVGTPPDQPVITATATDPDGNTSEFSRCVLNPDVIRTPAPTLGAGGIAISILLLLAVAYPAVVRLRPNRS
jgi:hypothetical protein